MAAQLVEEQEWSEWIFRSWWMACALTIAAVQLTKHLYRKFARSSDLHHNAIVVTGCDTGLGQALVREFAGKLNAVVFAGCLTPEGVAAFEGFPNVFPRIMDVTNDATIRAIVHEVQTKEKNDGLKLIAVINNAAVSAYGFAECLPMNRFEECMSVNFFGSVRTTKHFAPLLRKHKGRLVTIGTGMARSGQFNSAYLASKSALATFHECVRKEMKSHNVSCSLIEPGCFPSSMMANASTNGNDECIKNEDLVRSYATFSEQMSNVADSVNRMERLNGNELALRWVVDAVVDAVSSRWPQPRYLAGYDAWIIYFAQRWLPIFMLDWVSERLGTT